MGGARLDDRRTARRIALAILIVQGAHVLEHAVQWFQRYVLGEAAAKGVLGAWFDREWLHFTFNTVLFIALLLFLVAYPHRVPAGRKGSLPWQMFYAAVFTELYHEAEHVVKIYQYLVYGWDPAPGILGATPANPGLAGPGFELVGLHFFYNALVYVLVLPLLVKCWREREPHMRPAIQSAPAPAGGRRG